MAAKTKNQETVISYWLVPAKPEREYFNDVIRILAGQMKAPRFEPHLTIFSAPEDRRPRKNRGSRSISASQKKILDKMQGAPLHLHVRGIGASPEFRKTVFVKLNSSRLLERLASSLRRATKSKGKAPSDPHVSLLYQKLSGPTRRGLAAMVKLPFSHVVFDSIKAVRCSSSIEKRADVKAWRVLASKSLRQ